MPLTPSPSKMAANINPPWELILDLVAQFLDANTISLASCVSKPWNSAMSSDHLWIPLCLSHYPSSLHLISSTNTNTSLSPRRLFALLRTSSSRCHRNISTPRIALRDLIFAVDVFRDGLPVISLAKPGDELEKDCGGVFRFEIDVEAETMVVVDGKEELRVVWMVVMKGWRGAFLMMNSVGKGRLVGGDGLWFSEELPGPACCSAVAGGGGLVAELGLGLCGGGGRRVVERVSLGLMRIVGWRYVSVDDGLLYLQPFLLPPSI